MFLRIEAVIGRFYVDRGTCRPAGQLTLVNTSARSDGARNSSVASAAPWINCEALPVTTACRARRPACATVRRSQSAVELGAGRCQKQ